MTLAEKVNQLMLLSKGTMTGPDSAGRPNKPAEDLAREGIGFQMSAFEWSAADVNRIQRIAVKESRLGIPVVFATDIIHGYWTVFPVPLGLSATFDPADARVVAGISGPRGLFARPALDVRAHGRSSRRSALGPRRRNLRRIAAGEQRLRRRHGAAAFTARSRSCRANRRPRISASRVVSSTISATAPSQGGKDYAYVDLTERSIREFHLPPFAAGVAAGAPSVMPAFTTGPGGVPMSANKRLLQDVLRGELGFNGVLVSDYAGITEMRNHGTAADDLEAAVQALRDGTMTVDMEDGVYYAQLARAVTAGRLRVAEIDREVLRALAFKRRLGLFEKPYVPEDLEKRVRVSAAHRAAAREIARKSIVLLKNDANLLPLNAKRILVTGPLADAREDLLGPWHARGEAKDVVSVLAGIRERAAAGKSTATVAYSEGAQTRRQGQRRRGRRAAHRRRGQRSRATAISSSPSSASANRRAAKRRIARISTCPAASRRSSTRWSPPANPWSSCSSPAARSPCPTLVEKSGALVHAFFPGIEGGHALADVLFGDYNPGGKEPVTWPRSVGQLPIHHYDPPNGRPNIPERGDYKAHWLDESDEPLFAFGFGLSYTRFELSALEVPQRIGRADTLTVRVRLTNSGSSRRRRSAAALHPAASRTAVTGKRLQAYRRVHLRGGRIARRRVHVAREQPRGARCAGSLGARRAAPTK